MEVLWFVTPVHGRVELTRICLEQRARLLRELAGRGVNARQVIVGDDANLATARAHGFSILDRPNVLGRKINDGFEYACTEGGADHVVYTGSDDFMLAAPLADLPAAGRIRASGWNAWSDGTAIWTVDAPPNIGDAPWTVSREALAPVGFRPVSDELMSGIDTSMADRLGWDRFDFHADDDPLRWVGFKGGGEQITPIEIQIAGGKCHPFDRLATRYPADLVERLKEFYAK